MGNEPSSDDWWVNHFSLSLPSGRGQDDVPRLLRRVAKAIAARGDIEVQDLVMHTDVNEYGNWATITVYFVRRTNEVADGDRR